MLFLKSIKLKLATILGAYSQDSFQTKCICLFLTKSQKASISNCIFCCFSYCWNKECCLLEQKMLPELCRTFLYCCISNGLRIYLNTGQNISGQRISQTYAKCTEWNILVITALGTWGGCMEMAPSSSASKLYHFLSKMKNI